LQTQQPDVTRGEQTPYLCQDLNMNGFSASNYILRTGQNFDDLAPGLYPTSQPDVKGKRKPLLGKEKQKTHYNSVRSHELG